MTYHPEECIFDLIAACGPQSLRALMVECREQCTGNVFVYDCNSAADRANALNGAVRALTHAGILTVDEGDYDFTAFGYGLVIAITSRLLEFEAHKRATLG